MRVDVAKEPTCWFCGYPAQPERGELVAYAYVETPERHLFDGHAACARKNGVGGELSIWKPKT